MRLKFTPDDRTKGMYICGHHGTGKSTFIRDLALKDIKANRTVCMIDCTADLIPPVLAQIPSNRIKDIIYFSTRADELKKILGYTYRIPAVDFLNPRDETERVIISNDMANAFDLDDAKVAKPMLKKMITALLEANANGQHFGILDLRLFTQDPWLILKYCSDETRKFWKPDPTKKDFETVLHRLMNFETYPYFRAVITPSEKAIKIPEELRRNKILLFDLNDTESDYFLASLIISKIRQAAWRNADIRNEKLRPYCFLYIDEAHATLKFTAQDFETIMTRARKYHLCIAFTNQLPEDLPKEIQTKLKMMHALVSFQSKGRALVYGSQLPYTYQLKTDPPKPWSEARYAKILHLLTVDKPTGNTTEIVVDSKKDEPPDPFLRFKHDPPIPKGRR